MNYFRELGEAVAKRWMANSFDESQFPAIAAKALRDSPPSKQVKPLSVLRAFHKDTWKVPQMDQLAQFGQPPITVYYHPRFYIDLYFWLDGTTSIHQHAFSGAFHVLTGSSVHARYEFVASHRINSTLLLGDVKLADIDLLNAGDTREIVAGPKFVHSLFHLDRPSCTIVIRTPNETTGQPQYDYFPPHIAEAPTVAKLTASRRLALSLLKEMDPSGYRRVMRTTMREANFSDCYILLREVHRYGDVDDLNIFLADARKRHGELLDLVVAVFEETARRTKLIAKRQAIKNSEHRFFLALLLNVPDREAIMSLIRRRYPDAPAYRTVLRWLDELTKTPSQRSDEPNALGVEFSEAEQVVVEHVIRGSDFAGILLQLQKRFGPDEVRTGTPEIKQFHDALNESPFFRAFIVRSSGISRPSRRRA